MNFKTLFLLAALPGCALDLNGTGLLPADPPATDAEADAGTDTFKPHEASAPIVVDAAPARPDASTGNPLGQPANPDGFKACLTTCLSGCCDPAGTCWPGTTDNACGANASACSDCTAYAGYCSDGGVCSAGANPDMGCPPPFMINPIADAGQHCTI